MATLSEIVEAGPDPAVDHVVGWRRVDLRRVIARRFGIEFHERSVDKLLHRMGFAKLSVRPKHPQTDPAAQARWGKRAPRRPEHDQGGAMPTESRSEWMR